MYTGNLACAKTCHHCVLESHYRLHTNTAQAITQWTKSVTRQKALASCSHCSIRAVLQHLQHHLSHLVPRTECSWVKCMFSHTVQICPRTRRKRNFAATANCCNSEIIKVLPTLRRKKIAANPHDAERCISCPQQGADNTVTRDMHTITQRVKKCAASYQHFFPKLAQIFTRNARIARSHRARNNGTVTLRYAASDLAPHASWPHNAWLSSC